MRESCGLSGTVSAVTPAAQRVSARISPQAKLASLGAARAFARFNQPHHTLSDAIMAAGAESLGPPVNYRQFPRTQFRDLSCAIWWFWHWITTEIPHHCR